MHEYTSTARVWGLSCPGFPEEVSRARRWTRDILRDSPLADDAELIVSELSTNAIRHTASGWDPGSFHLAVAVSAQVVAVSVTDDGGAATAPKVEHQDHDAEHGRGLDMVSAIAHRVVVHDTDQGHTVTAELYADARLGGSRCR
ncbi:ATP-binding protein [Streptomyces lavenduligriseus]|uniref:ATP-binding protein n=1 Tax=Streptomyces lavenduligriseus TaxID=67315 RepID=A0ABT0NNC8_9ACTN|nr:ATP-binding protein [Streptomyces lavenduligriseus]MCL3992945.1 ATP-binding protein [Streptomyces lavenduligriseus]